MNFWSREKIANFFGENCLNGIKNLSLKRAVPGVADGLNDCLYETGTGSRRVSVLEEENFRA